jgi:phosphatidylglycerophosphatase A
MTPKQLLKTPSGLLALGFGSGLSPKAPGTVGTVAALPFLWGLAALPLWAACAVVFVALVAGIRLTEQVSQRMGCEDPSQIVWDEFVGMWIVLLGLPLNVITVPVGFLLFRFFDVVKPWPVSWADRKLPGGLGIMFDDVLAGMMAALVLRLLLIWVG